MTSRLVRRRRANCQSRFPALAQSTGRRWARDRVIPPVDTMSVRHLSRVVLLSCRSPFLDDDKVYPPLANLYLKSYLNAHLPDVEVVLGDDEYDLTDLSALEPFDLVGISVMTPQRQEALLLARAIKKRFPEKLIVAGGPHVRHYHSDLLCESCFDHLVPLEGEKALVQLLSDRPAPRSLFSPMSPADVQSQPRPDRTSDDAIRVLSKYSYQLNNVRATTLMTARGCPERCTFCEDALTAIRWSSYDSIRAQLSDITALGYGGVYIFDDLFAISLPKIAPICDALQASGLIYRCNAQARYFTKWGKDMARLLSESGCYEIAFGAESGSQRILDSIQKRCTVAENYLTVAYAKECGLVVKAFILIGLPGETWSTLAETEAFIRDSGIDDFQCAVYMPFKGTRIRRALDQGEPLDLTVEPAGADGEITGAYGTKGGETAYEVRTSALSAADLRAFRDYLLTRYRPQSHSRKWQQDRFFEQAATEALI